MPFLNNNNASHRFKRGIGFAAVIIAAIFALGGIVMYLWNSILIEVAPVKSVTYWQAMGLLVLCRILFGRFGKRHEGGMKKPFSKEQQDKLMSMSEEERAHFKEQWRKRCGK